jgi:hypothetical protein
MVWAYERRELFEGMKKPKWSDDAGYSPWKEERHPSEVGKRTKCESTFAIVEHVCSLGLSAFNTTFEWLRPVVEAKCGGNL